jgi:hypothetical protein
VFTGVYVKQKKRCLKLSIRIWVKYKKSPMN